MTMKTISRAKDPKTNRDYRYNYEKLDEFFSRQADPRFIADCFTDLHCTLTDALACLLNHNIGFSSRDTATSELIMLSDMFRILAELPENKDG